MKFESFAVTSAGNSNKINCENFFLNGICKDDVKRKIAFGENFAFGKKDIYAVADGSESAASGEEAAFTVVNILREFLGSDFRRTYDTFFGAANHDIAGRIFENNKKKEYADMAVLYIKGRSARVYNIGESSVFMLHNGKLKKLTGKVPETATVEESRIDEEDNLIVETVKKKTVKLLGTESVEYVVCPYVSGNINISANDVFFLCSKGVTENVSEETLKNILSDKKKSIDEKVSDIVHKAIEADEKSNATVVLVQSRSGFDFSWLRSKVFAGIVILMILALIALSSKDFIHKAARRFYNVYIRHDEVMENTQVDPWTPIEIPEDEEEEAVTEDPIQQPEAEVEVETPQNNSKPAVNNNKPPVQTTTQNNTVPSEQNTQPSVNENTTGGSPSGIQPGRVDNTGVGLPIDFN